MTRTDGPTLTDPTGMGGVNALGGFDYQVWDALARLPLWLKNPAFEGMAFETLEDVEARFFAPHSPRGYLLDRFQAKSGKLDKPRVKEVIESFRRFDAHHPKVARVQTLVTPMMPPALDWVARDARRVRGARPFYAPFEDIRHASDEKFRTDLIKELGEEQGSFFADHVEIDLRRWPDWSTAENAFSVSLEQAFPESGVSRLKQQQAFRDLCTVSSEHRGVLISRRRLFGVLEAALGVDLSPDRRLHVHVRSDRNDVAPDAIEIDASRFSGGEHGFPESLEWSTGLAAPAEAVARWARANGNDRVLITGSYRLSTSFVLGWAFRSVEGFELDIQTRAGTWATDEHPKRGDVLPWIIRPPENLTGERRLVVTVGVLRDPTPDVLRSLGLSGDANVLSAVLPQALTSALEAQVFVRAIKEAVTQVVNRMRPAGVDLYYAGPAAFTLALGHRWNALPPTQLHEFVSSDGRYVPTALVQ